MWATTSRPEQAESPHPSFGQRRPPTTYRLAAIVFAEAFKQALAAVGHPQEAERRTHFSMRWWRCRMRRPASWDLRHRPTPTTRSGVCRGVGRKGLGVKADDLIDPPVR